MIFFVLSGFFIHKSLVRSVSERRLSDFVVSRVNRIVPPFAFAIALTVALWAIAPMAFGGDRSLDSPIRSEFSISGIWVTAVFLNGLFGPTVSANGPLWSLSYEIWYYTLALLFALIVLGKRGGWVFIPALLILSFYEPRFLILGFVWMFGFVVSILHSNKRLPDLSHWPFLILAIIALVLYIQIGPSQESPFYVFEIALGAWFSVYLTEIVQREPGSFAPFTANFSYSLYVTHFPLLLFMRGAQVQWWVAVPTIAAAFICIGPWIERLRVVPSARSRQSTSSAVKA